ncbi:AtpZ/AtpI family protein [Chlorobaculum sp. 24CR]|uniref:AtpZ/AtpI family protein n=1 Tax=Chlorobaculum sp. 24CR TaxID=2508878 RepID=UPI00100B6B62|nr:AtpZ/AtpI family protein [Chlorobaculum sp. 24CR]RXK87744.1 AtpZ/AtpI family protein [Chlorobaculum sp. 24CR]
MFDNDRDEERFVDKFGESVRAMSDYFGLGLQIAASFAFFVFIGYWADSRLGTSPLFFLVGVLLGMVGMVLVLIKTVQKANRDHDSSHHQSTNNHEKDRRT